MSENHSIYPCLEVAVNLQIFLIKKNITEDSSYSPLDEFMELNSQKFFDPNNKNNTMSLSEYFASCGDILFYSSKKGKEKGLAADLFNLLVKILALGAFFPNGISFGEKKWQVKML